MLHQSPVWSFEKLETDLNFVILKCYIFSATLKINFGWCEFGIRKSRYYLPTPPLRQDMTQGQFLGGV